MNKDNNVPMNEHGANNISVEPKVNTKRFRKRWIFIGILTLFIYQCLYPDPMFYFGKSIDAQVLDVDTGEPVEDVVVVAFWLLDGGLEGGSNRGVVNVKETVTDAEGKFHFSFWGPKKIPHWTSWDARMKGDSPQILLYKKGYHPRQLRDRYKPSFFTSPITESSWDGKQIQMQKFEGDEKSYRDMVSRFNYVLEEIVRYKKSRCEWERFPKMIIATKSDRKFRTTSLYNYLIGREERSKDKGCLSFKQFIKEYEGEGKS